MESEKLNPELFDWIIIGSGQGGGPLAATLAGKGLKTAIIEMNEVGGSCINYGCTPTKSMAASANRSYLVKTAAKVGVNVDSFSVDFPRIMQRKDEIVQQFRQSSQSSLEDTENLQLLFGKATFIDQKMMMVRMKTGEEKFLRAEKIVINTGASPNIPPVAGIDRIPYLTSRTIQNLKELPEHLIVIGGSYIGLEFGQMFHRFGSIVTVLEKHQHLMKQEDQDLAENLQKILTGEGLTIKCGLTIKSLEKKEHEINLKLIEENSESNIKGSHLLFATGNHPNTSELGLDKTGVVTDSKGFIKVNEYLETNVKGIYAIGDVKGGPAFTHVSYDDYRVIRDNCLDNKNHSIKQRLVPYTMFTDPQLARIGLNEKEALQQGIPYRKAILEVKSIARAMETSQDQGMIKALVGEDDLILGISVLAPEAGELMSMVQVAMMGNLTYRQLAEAIISHPTWAEYLNTLFSKVPSS
jgi:pyruvate/2-oxoglutarate dehydrogenase complex dihydrolipoamide dehydrogenase (E3) component